MTITANEKGKVKFGINQLGEQTPKAATYVFRAVLYLSGAWAIIQHLNLGITKEVINNINEWAVAAPVLVHFTTRFFGWQPVTHDYDFDVEKVSKNN